MINAKGKLHTFSINYVSEMDGETYSGQFTSKKLSIMDQSRVATRKSELGGGMYCVRDENDKPTGQGIDEQQEFYNHMIAILEVTIVQAPQWWNLEELYDEDLISKVFGEVMKFENSFRRRGGSNTTGNQSDTSGQENGETEHQNTVNNNSSPKVVDEKVSSALDA